MTKFEKEALYPKALEILKGLGYDPEKGNVHSQFMERHKESMLRTPSRKRRPYKKKSKKNLK